MTSITNTPESAYPLHAAGGSSLGPAMEGGAAAGGGFGPADLLRIIKQRKLVIIFSFIGLYAIAVAATLITLFFFPLYATESYLELRPPPDRAFAIADAILRPDEMHSILETEARKLKQVGLLQQVVALPEFKQTAFYKSYDNDAMKCVFDLQKLVSAAPLPDTQLIRVAFSASKADEAQLIVKRLIERYSDQYRTDVSDRERGRVANLKTTKTKIEEDLRAKRTDLAAFRQKSDISQLDTQRTVLIQHVSDLRAQLSQLAGQIADQQAQLQQFEGLRIQDIPVSAEMKLIIENDPVLRYYRQQVEALDIELKASSGYIGENHRQYQILKSRRDGFMQQESSKREELIDDLRSRNLETLKQAIARLQVQQLELQRELEDAETKQRELDQDQEQFNNLLKDEKLLENQIEELGKDVMEAEHALSSGGGMRMNVAQEATKPVSPSRPDLVLWLAGGFVVSLLGAVGVGFLRELTDSAVRTPLDVARHGHLSVLGWVPHVDEDEADIDDIEHAVRKAPASLVAECFRQIRTTLQYSGPLTTQRSLLVTSARPGDGKTSVAVNLAVTLARGSQRVLLIDCNFRRPGLRAMFERTRPEGLSNVLVGEGRLQEFATTTEVPNLDVLTSGRMPANPSELLGSTYMVELLKDAMSRYDRVILDGPPVLLISDALVLATMVDGVIVVARAVTNTKGTLRRAREQLDKVGGHVIGAVLNGVEARPGGYFRQQYREFYDYTSDETIPPELPAPSEEPGDKSA